MSGILFVEIFQSMHCECLWPLYVYNDIYIRARATKNLAQKILLSIMYYSPSRAPQQSLQYRTTTQKGQDSNTGFRNEVKAMWNPYSFYLPFGATRGTSEVLYTQGTRYNYTGVKEEPSFGRIQHPIDETSGPRQQNHYHIATDTACYGVSHARLQQYNAIYRGREDIYKYYETPSPPTYVYEPIEHLQSEVVHHDVSSDIDSCTFKLWLFT